MYRFVLNVSDLRTELFKKMSDMNEALFYRFREYMESRLGGIELRLTRIESSLFNSETLDNVSDVNIHKEPSTNVRVDPVLASEDNRYQRG